MPNRKKNAKKTNKGKKKGTAQEGCPPVETAREVRPSSPPTEAAPVPRPAGVTFDQFPTRPTCSGGRQHKIFRRKKDPAIPPELVEDVRALAEALVDGLKIVKSEEAAKKEAAMKEGGKKEQPTEEGACGGPVIPDNLDTIAATFNTQDIREVILRENRARAVPIPVGAPDPPNPRDEIYFGTLLVSLEHFSVQEMQVHLNPDGEDCQHHHDESTGGEDNSNANDEADSGPAEADSGPAEADSGPAEADSEPAGADSEPAEDGNEEE